MSHVVQERVVNGLSNIAHRPLHVSGGDDLVGARSVLICGKNADLPTCHLLFVNVHRLREREKDENWGVSGGHSIHSGVIQKIIETILLLYYNCICQRQRSDSVQTL